MEKKISRGILIFLFFFLLIFGGAETERISSYVYWIVCPTVGLLLTVAILAMVAPWREERRAVEIASFRGS